MFKNIQKQLLLKHPLLWNTRFIPMIILGLFINLVYFFIGYADGTINFEERYGSDIDFTFFSFSFLISLIILILWLVAYLRNNSFKSFYPQSKNALFYEWIQTVVICTLLSMFYFTFDYGRELHKRNYMDEETAKKRCEIISKADFFIDAGFDDAEIDSTKSLFKDTIIDGTPKYRDIVYKDYVVIFGKKYSETALINRSINGFSFNTVDQNYLQKLAVRKILSENNTQEVKKIMQQYLIIVKEHGLQTNLSLDKWFEITYNYPEFSKYELIMQNSPLDKDRNYNNYYYEQEYEESIPVIKKNYSKYFIERSTLSHNYEAIANAYTKPISIEPIILMFYFVFGLSLLIFSFRVTSGKSWLIALVGLGIFNAIFGILSAASKGILVYNIMMLISIIIFSIYFFSVNSSKSGKKYSMIVLNLILWLLGALIPLCYFIYLDLYKKSIVHLENYYHDSHYQFLKDTIPYMLGINIIVVLIAMFLISKQIRNWKGISEE
ncbi:MAG: hypothetical protein V4548_04980 [Bacteroidota bacterium]